MARHESERLESVTSRLAVSRWQEREQTVAQAAQPLRYLTRRLHSTFASCLGSLRITIFLGIEFLLTKREAIAFICTARQTIEFFYFSLYQ